MKALITQREAVDQHSVAIDLLESTYVLFFENLGISLRPVSNFHRDKKLIFKDAYDLAILTGGGYIESKYYDKPHSYQLQTNRDITEKKVISEARSRKIPILAICRAMQLINGLYGGLTTRLDSLRVNREVRVDHPVLLGNEKIHVNNYHTSGILLTQLASNLIPIALDTENEIVEGFYHKDDRILGIQWHPERDFKNPESYFKSENLITSFIENGGELDEMYYISRRSGNPT